TSLPRRLLEVAIHLLDRRGGDKESTRIQVHLQPATLGNQPKRPRRQSEDFMNIQSRASIRDGAVVAALTILAGSLLSLSAFTQRGGVAQGTPVRGPNGEVWGFTDTAFNPNTRWRIHDPERPQPPMVTPGETVSVPAPSDAIVLFDGKDLAKWVSRGQNG